MIGQSQAERWLAAVPVRRSRRAYERRPVESAGLDSLRRHAGEFRPYPDSRVVLVDDAPAELFIGILGGYGRVTGAPSALIFVGPSSPGADHHVGYTGEAAVLEATALGLQTCWVGGFFRGPVANELAGTERSERVFAVSPVGHATSTRPVGERLMPGTGPDKPRLPLQVIAPGSERWPAWAVAGAEAVRLAPSAMHRQPWRLELDERGMTISADGASTPRVTKRLDIGIAMLHFELGARAAGSVGAWEELGSGRGVARWRTGPA